MQTSLLNKTDSILQNGPQWSNLHCSKDALTDMFGWFLQVLLACLAFTCLIGNYISMIFLAITVNDYYYECISTFTAKRFCEPRFERRPWIIWFYDTSKQGMGALVIHLANVYLAGQFQGDPCTW